MASKPRKRLSSTQTSTTPSSSSKENNNNNNTQQHKPNNKNNISSDPPIAPPKWGLIFKLSLFSIPPYLYLLFYHYPIEQDIRRSILINAAMSLAGFFVTVKLIPVASRYVLKRNLFGYDINKKGTPMGDIKVRLFDDEGCWVREEEDIDADTSLRPRKNLSALWGLTLKC
ncbi:hypothetical protein TanjilG_01936 [Lupinus angustifolius]|nr:hypothetical protein TanjilG_01936 [Lupinus angustifolius]